MKKIFKRMVLGLLALFIVLQLIPVDRSDPPVDPGHALRMPPEVEAILRPSCFDCHSNETRWPWYTYVAPLSWWIANHIHDGRRSLNFSEWTTMTPRQGNLRRYLSENPTKEQFQVAMLGRVEDVIMNGSMPLSSYLPMHPEARISTAQYKILSAWLDDTMRQLQAKPPQPNKKE